MVKSEEMKAKIEKMENKLVEEGRKKSGKKEGELYLLCLQQQGRDFSKLVPFQDGLPRERDKFRSKIHDPIQLHARNGPLFQFANALTDSSSSDLENSASPYQQMERFCPSASLPSNEASLMKHSLSFVNPRNREAMEALGYFVLRSEGKYNREGANLLFQYLKALPTMVNQEFQTQASHQSRCHAGEMTASLITTLKQISSSLEKEDPLKKEISENILHFFKTITETNNDVLMYGLLIVLGSGVISMEHQQLEAVSVQLLSRFKNPRFHILVLRAMKQLLKLPRESCHLSNAESFMGVAYSLFETQGGVQKNSIVASLKVIIKCGVLFEELTEKVKDFLEQFLKQYFELPGMKYSTEAIEEYKTALSGLTKIANKFHKKSSAIVDFIVSNLMEMGNTSENINQFSQLRDLAIAELCNILKTQLEIEGGDVRVVNSVFSMLYTPFYLSHQKYIHERGQSQNMSDLVVTGSGTLTVSGQKSITRIASPGYNDRQKVDENENLLINIIMIIGQITRSLNDERVTDLILSRLISRIHYPPQRVDELLIEQLTTFCLLGQEKSFNTITTEFMTLFRRIRDREIRSLMIPNKSIADVLMSLAVQIKEEKLRRNLAERVMKLFLQLGKETTVQDHKEMSSSLLIQGMGYLIPILAQLAQDISDADILQPDPNSLVVILFRNVWFYCVLFRFTEREAWRSDWFAATKKLASKVPALVSRTATNYKQMELDIEALLRNGYTEKELGQQQKNLFEFLPLQSSYAKNLPPTQVLHVLSIYYLETLRSYSGTFQPLFSYLEDPQIITNENLSECVRGIADKCFPLFILSLKGEHSSSLFNSLSTPSTSSSPNSILLENAENREEHETETLLVKYCSRSLSARKTSKNCIPQMLNAFPQISWNKRCIQTLLDLVDAVGKTCNVPMQGIVRLPSCQRILELPDDQKEREDLLRELVELTKNYIYNGINTAPAQTKSMLQEYMSSFREMGLGYLNHIGFSLAVEIFAKESRQITDPKKEKAGELPIQCITSQSSSFINLLELKAQYNGEVKGHMEHLGEEGMHKKLSQQLRSFLKEGKDSSSIHKFDSHLDFHAFNRAIFRSVAFITMQSKPPQELVHLICWSPVLLFTKDTLITAVSAWNWILAVRPDLQVEVMTEISNAWYWTIQNRIGLFSDVKRPLSPVSVNRVVYSQDDLGVGRNDPSPHAVWIDFLSERFTIIQKSHPQQLQLILRMTQQALANSENFNILPAALSARFKLLLLCMQILHSKLIHDNLLETLLRNRVYKCTLNWFCFEPIWYNQDDRRSLANDVKTLIEFCKRIQAEERETIPHTSTLTFHQDEAINKQETFQIRDMQKTRRLILLLIGNEIERILAWTNPQNLLSKKIADEDLFNPGKVANWPEIVSLSWDISPALAIQLNARFPGTKLLKRALERKVQSDPGSVVDIPEAFPFLVNETTVKENIKELKYVLYWAPVTPPVAISLLQAAYNSSLLVIQYAVRVLHNFSPETIIYYIPQLVQTLRYDVTGSVFQYLLNVSKESELLAHQLIWNIQTYTKTQEQNRLTATAGKLKEAIIAGMTPEVLQRYKIEFEFFKTVTKISAILLKEAETKEARKPLLVSELKKLPAPSLDIYLPTNPDTKVHGIFPEKASALQSAAKAPILVAFDCHTRESETHVDGQLKWTKPFIQACIFKTGDDVRQDMLAIQIIDLFQRIFKTVGLDLFLYPYKVIATKPDCGLIEVVPNAVSRDALGKKLENGLYDYFVQKYGPPSSEAFQIARLNFIKSMAAYAVVCFLLNIKDRHNGNILVDEAGHIVHIDFGFIFDTSPGGDIGFEVAPFKMSAEMIEIMGGRPDAEPFKYFMELSVKAFLAARQHSDAIITLVTLMLETNLPSLKPEQTIENLKTLRLVPDKTEKAAAKHFTDKIIYSFGKFASFTTLMYDVFQNFSQGIDYY
eukprot:TRINITY_DN2825_c0_g1_i1.p1 TRINITY_DN2825_c0_g1~~TRINITY_DN2825_c0_g1_i1.p1  ORF type:complete len:1936 (+),score=831.43 TRINITY_DN2825_c0_g1_i1:212-6019(+)